MPGRYGSELPDSSSTRRPGFATVDGGGAPGDASVRDLRRLFSGPVTVVTTIDDRGFHGITVSAFCVASLAPPAVLICLGSQGEARSIVETSGRFAVSLLSDRQEFLADRFAGRAPLVNARFDGVKHRLTGHGLAVLEECLAWFDCEVSGTHDVGDHVTFFGRVVEAGYGTGSEPLLYFDGAYRTLTFS
jgi:flavin reductase (DIM6/NTAB) family NADH-FMN oxidoreductase RutF